MKHAKYLPLEETSTLFIKNMRASVYSPYLFIKRFFKPATETINFDVTSCTPCALNGELGAKCIMFVYFY